MNKKILTVTCFSILVSFLVTPNISYSSESNNSNFSTSDPNTSNINSSIIGRDMPVKTFGEERILREGANVYVAGIEYKSIPLSSGTESVYFKKSTSNGTSFDPTIVLYKGSTLEGFGPTIGNLDIQIVQNNLTISWTTSSCMIVCTSPVSYYSITSQDRGDTFESLQIKKLDPLDNLSGIPIR
jgi:hypothetical protein